MQETSLHSKGYPRPEAQCDYAFGKDFLRKLILNESVLEVGAGAQHGESEIHAV